ncbi:hypothetical protein FOPG_04398 [Fusarium oxysporum f. sp. conglutinans race 2 54008]|uniref:Uncharacterized protein n=1 Tax=Fusarium oxysporum f. sp. conglutinans race 2 54008 TaxID=1089457 RepID=X0IEJ4_FUSOX|nr:hypothetical protein FOPG_04398 [Fusarium oxysporum f. sp. conglutinans race 2 54008]EXL82557.1 hypothetical protein FOPG_04398 [Fusarium oxysporum f. sp. conglutinans race 2 54008]KAI8410564.1 hypothetical protein FOFC_10421 [Fusarium oxysporum]
MFIKTVIILLASLSHGKEILQRRHDGSSPIIDQFPWSSFLNKTGLDPLQHLKPPSDDTPETLACTTEPGPDRLACPVAIAAWSNLADAEQYIYIPFDQCLSATEGTCRTVACAPTGNLTIKSDEITGRMWNPVSTKCVFGGVGGIWQNDGSTLVIEMGYASQE